MWTRRFRGRCFTQPACLWFAAAAPGAGACHEKARKRKQPVGGCANLVRGSHTAPECKGHRWALRYFRWVKSPNVFLDASAAPQGAIHHQPMAAPWDSHPPKKTPCKGISTCRFHNKDRVILGRLCRARCFIWDQTHGVAMGCKKAAPLGRKCLEPRMLG